MFVLAAVAMAGCQKDRPTVWEVNNSIPLLNTTLDLTDIVGDSLLTEDVDHRYSLLLNYPLLRWGLDSVLDLQIDTISNSFTLPFLTEWEFDSNVMLYSSTDGFELEDIGAELNTVTLQHGILHTRITNTIAGELQLIYSIPKAVKNGSSFEVVMDLAPATAEGPAVTEIDLDISGYTLDLTGPNGTSHNELTSQTRIYSGENGGNAILITNADQVKIQIVPAELEVSFAHGYFGQHEIATGPESITVEELNPYLQTQLDLESASAEISLTNGFGTDLSCTFYQFAGTNTYTGQSVALQFPEAGVQQYLSRATDQNGTIVPGVRQFSWTAANSNLADFIEMIPNNLQFNLLAEINPLGNISNYNDFAWENSALEAKLSLKIPLNLAVNNLRLTDTTDFSLGNDNIPTDAELLVLIKNTFPASLDLHLNFLNADSESILTSEDISTSPIIVLPPGAEAEWMTFRLILNANDMQSLVNATSIAVTAKFQTPLYPEHQEFTAQQQLEIKAALTATNEITVR